MKYIQDNVNSYLEELVTYILINRPPPEDVHDVMLEFLKDKYMNNNGYTWIAFIFNMFLLIMTILEKPLYVIPFSINPHIKINFNGPIKNLLKIQLVCTIKSNPYRLKVLISQL